MFLRDITEHSVGPALVKTLAFQESRLKMIAENIANAQTPGYRAKQLNVAGFQHSLREALKEKEQGRRSDGVFEVRSGNEVRTDENGFLSITPSEEPVENVLFHDGTNISMEKEMADLAQTGLWSDLASKLLQTRFGELRRAIRGTA